MSKKAKIIFIIAIILIIAAIIIGVILGYRKISTTPGGSGGTFPIATSSSSTNVGGSGQNVQNEPGSGTVTNISSNLSHLTQLTKGPVIDYWITSSTVLGGQMASSSLLQSDVFYLKDNGDVVRIKSVGSEMVKSSFGQAPLRIIQSVTGLDVIIEFTSHSYALFNVSRNAFEWLPDKTVSAAFSPDGKKLAYLASDVSGKQSLFIRDLTSLKKATTKVLSLSINDVSLAWPVGNRIYFMPPQSADFVGEIWYFDTQAKLIKQFASGAGVGAVFSQATSSALVFYNTGSVSISAQIKNTKTGTSNSLPISTLLSKCAFSFDSADAVCAAPQVKTNDSTIQLPDYYNSMKVFTNDYLYFLSSKRGYTPQNILDTIQVPFDAKDLKIRSDQIFFVNRLDDSLYMFDMRGL
jgi:hypothetical protein